MGCHTRHYFYSAEKQKEWRDFVVRSFREMTQKCYDGLSEESVKENFDFYHSLYIRSVSSAKEFLNDYNNPEKRQVLYTLSRILSENLSVGYFPHLFVDMDDYDKLKKKIRTEEVKYREGIVEIKVTFLDKIPSK